MVQQIMQVDIASVLVAGGDPCADPMTPILLTPYLAGLPDDATLFTVDDGVNPPQANLARTDTFVWGSLACDDIGQQIFTITIEDGTSVGLSFTCFLIIGDYASTCVGCGP